jgi:hypothetical protein
MKVSVPPAAAAMPPVCGGFGDLLGGGHVDGRAVEEQSAGRGGRE